MRSIIISELQNCTFAAAVMIVVETPPRPVFQRLYATSEASSVAGFEAAGRTVVTLGPAPHEVVVAVLRRPLAPLFIDGCAFDLLLKR